MKISKKTLLIEIRTKGGNLSEIAKAHNMTYAGVLKRVKEDSDLTAALQESRETLVDEAQAQLCEAVRSGSAWAVKFVLETWGKGRGFTKQLEVVDPDPKCNVVVYIPDNGRTQSAKAV
jgi:hypothetical protein